MLHPMWITVPGLAAPDPALITIVVLRSSYAVPLVKLIRKSLLGSLPHDIVTRRVKPQIAGVIRWSMH